LLTREAKASAPRDSRFGKGWDRPLLVPNAPYEGIKPQSANQSAPEGDFRYTFPDNDHIGLSGLAVHNGLLVASLPKMNQLLWVDAAKRKILGTLTMKDPRGCAFDSEGRLLVLSGARLLRLEIGENPLSPASSVECVKANLEDPRGIALDDRGTIYISDWGRSHQVKVFSSAGQFLRSIGRAGEPAAGRYDPGHMNHPQGITIDSRNRLWVAEEDFQPKRVSVWSLDGKLIRDFLGSVEYGGGGRLDPRDKTRFYYHGIEFKLDWSKGTDELVAVFHRPAQGEPDVPDGYGAGGKPDLPLYSQGRQYMANCYSSHPTQGAPIAMLWLMEDQRARPVAALGDAHSWSLLRKDIFKPRWPAGVDLKDDQRQTPAMFSWSDLNANGQVDPDEVTFWKARSGGVTVMPDLTFVVSRVDERSTRYAPERILENGAPHFDPAKGQALLAGVQPPASSGGDQALFSQDGWTVVSLGAKPFAPESLCGGKDGRVLWSYPSLWPGRRPVVERRDRRAPVDLLRVLLVSPPQGPLRLGLQSGQQSTHRPQTELHPESLRDPSGDNPAVPQPELAAISPGILSHNPATHLLALPLVQLGRWPLGDLLAQRMPTLVFAVAEPRVERVAARATITRHLARRFLVFENTTRRPAPQFLEGLVIPWSAVALHIKRTGAVFAMSSLPKTDRL
jgi:hypothetical protein